MFWEAVDAFFKKFYPALSCGSAALCGDEKASASTCSLCGSEKGIKMSIKNTLRWPSYNKTSVCNLYVVALFANCKAVA